MQIFEQRRLWPERQTTYFILGHGEYKTGITIPDTTLDDLPKTKEYQSALDEYVIAVSGRARCGSFNVFICVSGFAVKIDIQGPIEAVVGRYIQCAKVEVTDAGSGNIAKVAVEFDSNMFNAFELGKGINICVRRAIDDGHITFHAPDDYQKYFQTIVFGPSVKPQKPFELIESFLITKVYKKGFELATNQNAVVWVLDPWDAEYLGVTTKDFQVASKTLLARDLITLDPGFEYAQPTKKLIAGFNEQVSEQIMPTKLVRLKLPTKDVLQADAKKYSECRVSFAVVVIDLDNFKSLNDKLGHDEGDECLDRVVEIAGRVLGTRGKFYRWGAGDEFVALLPFVSSQEAAVTAERIRKEIFESNPPDKPLVTASVGVCATDVAVGKSVNDVINLADKATLEAKQGGKNKVVVSN